MSENIDKIDIELPSNFAEQALLEIVRELNAMVQQLKEAISTRVKHDENHFKFYCPTCDSIDGVLANLLHGVED